MFENLELQWCAKCKVKHHQLNPRNPTFVNSIALGPWSSGSPCVPSGIGEDKSKSQVKDIYIFKDKLNYLHVEEINVQEGEEDEEEEEQDGHVGPADPCHAGGT